MLFVPSVVTYTTAPDTTDAQFYQVDAHVVGYGAKLTRYNNADAIDIANSSVLIEGLHVTSSGSGGVDCSGGTLVLRNVRVEGASSYGIRTNCDVTIVNSLVAGNRGGGLSIDGPQIFRIANNWIIDNGDTASTTGGARLFTPSTQSYFEFNTIAYNRSATGFVDGLFCDGPQGSTLFRNNIVIGSAGKEHLGSNGIDTCRHEYTLVAPDNGVTGTGNMTVATPTMFAFRDIGTHDYHLLPNSIAVGKGSAAMLHAESMLDIDGEPRTGTSIEVGADELP